MKLILALVNIFILNSALAVDYPVEKSQWGNLEVVWLEDDRYPTYTISVYFADGALSDEKGKAGETSSMFDLLTHGTRRFSEGQISDVLDYYGVSYGSNVVHEYSTFTFAGLIKDLVPTSKLFCHIFRDANFPKGEVKKYKGRLRSSLRNLVSSPSELANRVFRKVSLGDSPYQNPPGGTIRSIKKIYRGTLKQKRIYFNKQVKKRIYITGPKQTHVVKNIFLNDCEWGQESETFVRKHSYISQKGKKKTSPIYLVPVPKSNQSQVRVDRILEESELKTPDLSSLSSGFLGGGYTSLLMKEARVKRGLTYGISAFASGQRGYGRLGIMTSTKSGSTVEMLNVIKQTLEKVGNGDIDKVAFQRAVSYLAGSSLFKFEKNSAFLGNLLFFDHTGREYDELYNYPKTIRAFTQKDVSHKVKELFSWDKQDIVIIGDKKLKKSLSKIRPVKILNYKNYL